jgi:Protein of unknown function (DUF5131)
MRALLARADFRDQVAEEITELMRAAKPPGRCWPVTLDRVTDDGQKIWGPWCPLHGEVRVSWVVVGGESGPLDEIRPMDPEWARSLQRECETTGVAFHFKQTGTLLAREWGCTARAPTRPSGQNLSRGNTRVRRRWCRNGCAGPARLRHLGEARMNREIDAFYVQRWSPQLGAWDHGRQFVDLKTAITEARVTPKLRRIVRYRTSNGRIGSRDDLLTIWQGVRVPDWLGEVSPA